MKNSTIQTPPFALAPACAASAFHGGSAMPMSARLRVEAGLWAASAAKRNHNTTDVTGSPPRGTPV